MSQNSGLSRRRFLQATLAASVGSSLLAESATSPLGFIRYPNIQNLSASGGSIIWTLATQVTGSVVVTDPSGHAVTHPAMVTEFDPPVTGLSQIYYQYSASIGNLQPGTTYAYQVQADSQTILNSLPGQFEFTTPGDGPFSFLQFADSGEGNAAQLALSLQMIAEKASLVIANGDLAYQMATYASIDANYYGVYRQMMAQVPFFASLGNHEYYTDNASPMLLGRVTPTAGVPASDAGRYYSFDWGNAHFVALDSNAPLDDAIAGTGSMLTWLDQDLQSTGQFWRIVFFHHPGYATGEHQDEPPAGEVRQAIVPILEKHGVQLVLNGHEHTYQRTHELLEGKAVAPNSGGIVYLTSGGGGAGPYYTAPNDLIAKSIGVNNYVVVEVSGAETVVKVRGLGVSGAIDSVVLKPEPQLFSALNSASFTTALASGGALTISGRNLSPVPFQAELEASVQSPKHPPGGHGASVTLNGVAVPVLYADAGQMNCQIPFDFSGSVTLIVLTRNGTAQTTIQVAALAPQFFMNADGSVMAKHADGSAVSPSSPARGSEKITLFLTGLGAVDHPVEAGTLPPVGVGVLASVKVTIGGIPVSSLPPVLSVSYPGIYQIQVQLPAGLLGGGTLMVQAFANSVASNTPFLSV